MSDSLFTSGMNSGNTAFGVIAGETFTVVGSSSGGKGTPGDYVAVSIDDLVAASAVQPGGLRSENTVNIWISRAVFDSSLIAEGDKLIVRGKRVRIMTVTDEADNTLMLSCQTTGVKMN